MLKTFLFLLPLVLAVESRIQVPFLGAVNNDLSLIQIQFNASVGVPEQEFQFVLGTSSYTYSYALYLKDKATYGNGFDSIKSSTFHPVENITAEGGNTLNATETVKLGGHVIKNKPVQLVYKADQNNYFRNRIGVDKYIDGNKKCEEDPEKCTSFVQSVLREQKEQVLVLAFDKIQKDLQQHPFTGQMVLGERPNDLCKSNWAFLEELPLYPKGGYTAVDQWSFNISSVTVGKYSWKKPVGWALFVLNNRHKISIPSNIYKALLKSNGVQDGDQLPCSSSVDIVFNLNGLEIKLTPEMYLKKAKNGFDCEFAGVPNDGPHYELPVTMLSEYCLAYNYERPGLEITKRVEN